MFERETVAEAETGASTPLFDGAERQSTTALHLDDLRRGQRFTSGSLRVEEAVIKAFATRLDPQPFHLDENAARTSLFGGLAAAGELAWPRPTRPGDVLTMVGGSKATSASERQRVGNRVTPPRARFARREHTCRA